MKKKYPNVELTIEKIAAEGRGIAKHDGLIYFVEKAIPGDVVDTKIKKKKKDYAIAQINKYVKKSDDRIESVCTHFGTCGGCYWQNVAYEKQLAFKQQIVVEVLKKIGRAEIENTLPILGANPTFYYRNKMEYTFSDRAWLTDEQIQSEESFDRRALGFHVAGSFASVLHIDACFLQHKTADEIRNSIFQFALQNDFSFCNLKTNEGFLRNLIIRNTKTNEWMVTVCFAAHQQENIQQMMQHILNNFPFITSLNYIINTKNNDTIFDQEVINFNGRPFIIEQLKNIQYKISTKSFFQTNSYQAENLYDVVVQFAQLKHTDIVYDLYCGTGSIALYLANQCKQVIGIEQIEDAIVDATENASLNKIDNATFYVGTVEKILDEHFLEQHPKADVVILDPPRAGLHEKVIETLLVALPKKIVYVSCNPATQARDIQLLNTAYKNVQAQAVDMFPHTYHIENVILLELME
ncbi:MAG: 23S rRNA (uracil(1939)-C(5))-methyltransferase RlmD [Sphingobacteriales bacterium]|nr:MAG: 23S rRNA (uracil(1939)-C(5))-methyltransferase RlmD [Sphingobacteriales bacterium]